jgi:membrane-bound ClpP family serine protease
LAKKEIMKKAKYYYHRWLWQAPVGLVLIGFGACLIAEAAMLKFEFPEQVWNWVGYGTLALVVFNSGLSLFGDAILHRMRYERMQE